MKNNHKKLIASIALVGTMAAGGTFALLQTTTNTATNNFTSNQKISGALFEDSFKGNGVTNSAQDKFDDADDTSIKHIKGGTWENYLPTQEHAKDPKIKIYKGNVNSRVAMKLTYYLDQDGNGTFDSNETVSYDNLKDNLATIKTKGADGFNTTNWEQDENDKSVFFYKGILTPTPNEGATTEALFDTVRINDDVTKPKAFKIEAKGYAVQAEGTDTNANYKTALKELMK